MAIDTSVSVRELALSLPGATAVFEELGLDYCCGGRASLASACAAAGLPLEHVTRKLEEASSAASNVASFHDWRAEETCAVAHHVVDENYPFEREAMADTAALIAQVASVHGAEHPELREIERVWAEICERMHKHLHEEGRVLEPMLDASGKPGSRRPPSLFAGQHEVVVALVRRIRALTNGYAELGEPCDAIDALYAELAAFEADLHEHVLLTDAVLFRDPPQRA